jgi:predicted ATPase/transcriptional regulator with XRE-family HTH domain/Tfp pilus assembly protein PilF
MNTSPLPSFGELLRQYRRAAGLSQEELADQAQLSRDTISLLERGLSRVPRRDTIALLADALQLSSEDRRSLEDAARQHRREVETQSPASLPASLTTLIGREVEIARGITLLTDDAARLLTVTGPAGVGKTRVAIAIAAGLVDVYAERTWLIDLSAIHDAAMLPQVLMSTLRVREKKQTPMHASLVDHLRSLGPTLLIWDNCEHLLDACSHLAQTLLQACPHLRLMLTSREPTHVSGEVLLVVPPFALPVAPTQGSWEEFASNDSVRLFLDRANLRDPDMKLTATSAAHIAAICARVDGLPLAIELAAARVRVMTLEQIAARVAESLSLLSYGSRGNREHHHALRATLDWSYGLLSPEEQTLFCRLSVFAGSFSLEAMAAICVDEQLDPEEGTTCFLRLVEHSLVSRESVGVDTRYRLLETIWRYAREHLAHGQEVASVQQRHRDWYLKSAETAEIELRGEHQATWLERLDAEHANIRSALQWSYEQGESEAGLRMAGSLLRFWLVRGSLTEGCQWLQRFLDLHPDTLSPLRVKALRMLGNLSVERGDFGVAAQLAETCIGACQALGDEMGHASALNLRGMVAKYQGDAALAITMFSAALALHQHLGNTFGIAADLNNLGAGAMDQGNYEQAADYFTESLALCRQQQNQYGVVSSLGNLAIVARLQGALSLAGELAQESLHLARNLADQRGMAMALRSLGEVARRQGDFDRASEALKQCEHLFHASGSAWGVTVAQRHLGDLARDLGNDQEALARYQACIRHYQIEYDAEGIDACLRGIMGVEQAQGACEIAAQLGGSAETVRRVSRTRLDSFTQAAYDRDCAALQAMMSPVAFAAAWAAGQRLTPEQAMALALAQ